MYLIIGRTASGKDKLASYLEKDVKLKGVVSSTTRKPRNKLDFSHRFVNQEIATKELKYAVAKTNINDNWYYTRKEDIEGKDFYIIDLIGAKKLVKKFPEKEFKIIYVQSNDEIRKERFIKRGNTTEEEYIARNKSENSQFTKFEKGKYKWPDNVTSIDIVNNNKLKDLKVWAMAYFNLLSKLKIYISGPISGIDNYKDNFNKAAEYLSKQGFTVVNPSNNDLIVKDAAYDEYMHICYAELDICDIVYFLSEHENSLGASLEKKYAEKLGLVELCEDNGLVITGV